MTTSVRRDDYRPPPFLVDRAELVLDLDFESTRVTAHLDIRRNPATAESHDLWLDGEQLILDRVSLDGAPLPRARYRHEPHGLRIADVPAGFSLATDVRINPQENTEMMGLYRAGDLLCTQCEPEAFRRITFFPDRPDVPSVFRVTLNADPRRFPVLLANGNPRPPRTLPDGRASVTWDDPFPKPSYLFAVVAGDLCRLDGTHRTPNGREVAIHLFVEPANRDRGGHALDTVRRVMAWDESRFGRVYDLDVFNLVAVSAYTMGAMENKGLNIFNDRYVLADPATATDRDYRDIEALVAHEYLHNWSGNRVTCRDWFQLALKEGFTVYREQAFVADQGWGEWRRLEDAAIIRERQFAEDAGPLAHPPRPSAYRRIDNFYTDTVYGKGAEIVRMLATLIGEADFRRGTDLFFERYDGEAVTIEDFLACMAEVSGRDLAAFARWYDHAGTLVLRIETEYRPEQKLYQVTIRQECDDGDATPLHFPFTLALRDPDGRLLAARMEHEGPVAPAPRTLEIDRTVTRLKFRDIERPPLPSLLRGFSAPARVVHDLLPATLAGIALHDDDAYARWDALQRLACRCLLAADGESPGARELLATTYEGLLADPCDRGILAACIALPDLQSLTLPLSQPDYETLHQRLSELRTWLGLRLSAHLERILDHTPPNHAGGPPGPAGAGARALAHRCLDYRVATGETAAIERAARRYREAANMTDRLSALSLLAHTDDAESTLSLADFRRRWADEPLVMDQWLAVQARSRRDDTLERVRELTDDPVFDPRAPNRVRALIETFCRDNPRAFHRNDGAGYRFLADWVLAIDPENPPLAAGLLRPLTDWRRQSPRRRRHMHEQLVRVARARDLSALSQEIAAAGLER